MPTVSVDTHLLLSRCGAPDDVFVF